MHQILLALVIQAAGSDCVFSWTHDGGNVDPIMTSMVYTGPTADNLDSSTDVGNVTLSSCSDIGITEPGLHWAAVSGVNEHGEGDQSNVVSVTLQQPQTDPPGPPVLTVEQNNGGGEFDPVAAHAQLLTESAGYFKAAGGTGGHGGEVVYVTNLDSAGPGSMREALVRPQALIVMFEDGLNGEINLLTSIDFESNKTLIGRHRDGTAADIFIHPIMQSASLAIKDGSTNVIITNIKGDAPGPNDTAPDMIFIAGTGLVWVHHVTGLGDGSSNMDGFIDVHAPNVTLSWNRVQGWDNVHLMYPYPGDRNGLMEGVTLHHNLYRGSRGRQPKIDAPGIDGHFYNNWIDNWEYDGVRITAGEAVVENNIFTPGAITTDPQAIQGVWDGGGNILEGDAFSQATSISFTVPYPYTLEPLTNPEEVQALKDKLEAQAGWRSTFE